MGEMRIRCGRRFSLAVWAFAAVVVCLPTVSSAELVLRPFIGVSNLEFNRLVDGEEVAYKPNPPLALGLGVAYGGFGGSLSIGVGAANEEAVIDESKAIDFSLYWQGEQWGVDTFFQIYEGLYAERTEGCAEPADCEPLPDAGIRRFGATVTYVWDPALSLRAAFAQSGDRTESGGSWMLLGGVDYAQVDLATGADDDKRGLIGGTAGGGYGHHWIGQAWWFAFSFQVGLGALRYEEDDEANFVGGAKGNLKFSTGYDKQSWFAGLLGFADAIGPFGESNQQAQWQSMYFELFLGLRY